MIPWLVALIVIICGWVAAHAIDTLGGCAQ